MPFGVEIFSAQLLVLCFFFALLFSIRDAERKKITLSLDKVRAEIKTLIKIICLFSAFLEHMECTYHFTRAHSHTIECG